MSAIAQQDRRTAPVTGPRRYLMCPPTYFDVRYSINPWMDASKPVDVAVAVAQWERIRDTLRGLGHRVDEMTPAADLPDMVFAANGATVAGGRVVLAQFRHAERTAETWQHRDWFHANDFTDVHASLWAHEGQGDCLQAGGGRLLCGTGFRTSPNAHGQLRRILGAEVVSLTLVDPRFYHLDTALAVLSEKDVMYYPEAFSPGSRELLRDLYPDAILATGEDASAFGLNAVSDGTHVVLPQAATGLAGQLSARGYRPVGVDVSELMKAGGAVKCCVLELHGC